jgi:hypothetical protein
MSAKRGLEGCWVISGLNVEEREEVFLDIAKDLERTAMEALFEGNLKIAQFFKNVAEAMFVKADEFAREDVQAAHHVLSQATNLHRQFEHGPPPLAEHRNPLAVCGKAHGILSALEDLGYAIPTAETIWSLLLV